MTLISRTRLDKFYYYYFLIHIPITIFIDSSLIIPSNYQLSITRFLVSTHIKLNKDFLLSNTPKWLKFFGLIELSYQLPFFIWQVVVLSKTSIKEGDDGSRSWAVVLIHRVIYLINVLLTTMCCMVCIGDEYTQYGLSKMEMYNLMGIYAPYCVIAMVLLIDSSGRIVDNCVDANKGSIRPNKG